MSCKYNNCKICGYKSECEIYKENAELTDELKSLREYIKDYGAGCYENGLRNGKRKQEEQIAKAKDFIRNLKSLIEDVCDINYLSKKNTRLLVEAEQFLKGEFTTELSNECQDCTKFDEMPNGPRCKTCDNGSHFQKKEEA